MRFFVHDNFCFVPKLSSPRRRGSIFPMIWSLIRDGFPLSREGRIIFCRVLGLLLRNAHKITFERLRKFAQVISCSFLTSFQVWAGVHAELSNETISLQESVQFILTIEGPNSNQTPNLIPLQKQFDIESTEHQVSTTIINGKMQSFNQWKIGLSPKKAGTLQIPPIQVGAEQSNPVTLTVTHSTTSKPSSHAQVTSSGSNPLQLDVELNEKKPYLHQQMVYTVRLLHRDQLLNATYIPPSIEDAIVVPLGEGDQYEIIQNGQSYVVEEQKYALFPQKTGKQTIKGPQFQALIYRSTIPEQRRARAEPTSFSVQPIPSDYSGKDWLPASAITLSEQYDQVEQQYQVGQTITRTITLESTDLPAELLPTLPTTADEHFSVYPEKPKTQNKTQNDHVIGIKTLKITYLLNQPGQITLPAYTLTWFNTKTKKSETSLLPPRAIQITSVASANKPVVPPKPEQILTNIAKPTPPTSAKNARIPWMISGLFALLWILTVVRVYWKKNVHKKQHQHALDALQQAFTSHNPHTIREALIAYAQQMKPNTPILDLDDVKQVFPDAEIHQKLVKLTEILYSDMKKHWQDDTLFYLIKNYPFKRTSRSTKRTIPALNPTYQE